MTQAATQSVLGRLEQRVAKTQVQHPFLFGILVAIAVTAGIRLSDVLLTPLVFYESGSAVCWPTDGILLAVLLMSRRRNWPWIAAGFALDQILANKWPLPGIALDTFCNLFEIFFPAFFLPSFRTMAEWLGQPRLVLRFTLIAVLGAPLGAALMGAAYFHHMGIPKTYWDVVLAWESSDAMGIALWTPLILTVFSLKTYELFRRPRLPETLFLMIVLLVGGWFTFNQNSYPLAFLLFPMLVVLVESLGFSGAVLSVNAVTIIASSATIRHHGPFMFIQGVHEPYRIVNLQIYLVVAMVMSFSISLSAQERQALQGRLQLALSQMESLATIDALTGVGNRRLFDVTLDSEWKRARRDRTTLSLLLLDADEFKRYNDLYGHLAGDACLRQIGSALAAIVQRAGDLVARYGGEEFVALLPRTTLQQAVALAEELREHIKSLRIDHEGLRLANVTVSIGCSTVVPRDDLKPGALVHAADRALYLAKQRGRDRVEALTIEASEH